MLWLSVALAGRVPGVVLPSPEPPTAPALYEQGGGEGELACRALVDEVVLLCFRIEAEGKRRYITTADLAAWDTSLADLEALAASTLTENPLKPIAIEGGGSYWQSAAPVGREAVVLLHPEWLAIAGENPVVGIPSRGVVVVWSPGDDEVDTMVSVGVTQMHGSLPHPITPVVLQKDEEGWSRWGEARKR